MARTMVFGLLLSLLLVNLLHTHQTVATGTEGGVVTVPPSPPRPTPPPINCTGECGRRCGKTKRPNRCKRACLSCCHRCNCVPPGTFGNKQLCPCYASLINPRNGVPKCP